MARQLVAKKVLRAQDIQGTSLLELNVAGGLAEGVSELRTKLDVDTLIGRMRRVYVRGGLPVDDLPGEHMTAEQRKEYNEKTYAAIFGSPLKAKLSEVATPTEEQQP